MSMQVNGLYEFGPYRLDSAKRMLTRDGEPILLQPKAFDLLLLLVEGQGRVLTKSNLMQALWPGMFVEEANLSFQISSLRKALGQQGARWIETVPKHGYRFSADIKELAPAAENAVGQFQRRWRTGGTIAVAVFLAISAMTFWRVARPTKSEPRPELVRLTSDPGLTTDPALSPDNRLLAYASDRAGAGDLDIWVGQISGGDPIRLTDHPADDHEPTFSPDGNQIAFRSERDAGGVYVVSAMGGTPRLLAKYGRRPRYSPDGSWVAYWVGSTSGLSVTAQGSGKIFVVPSDGGEPRDLEPQFAAARYPVWSEDGKWLLFVGSRVPHFEAQYLDSRNQLGDWYVIPARGGAAQETGILPITRQQRLGAPLGAVQMAPSEWRDDRVIFAATSGDSTNLWQIRLPIRSRKASAPPERLTLGTGLEIQPTFGTTLANEQQNAVVFAGLTANMDIWGLDLRSDGLPAAGEPVRLTENAAGDFVQALSPSGNQLVFVSNRTGKAELWMKNLETNREVPFSVKRGLSRFSSDGSVVGHNTVEPNRPIYVTPAGGGISEKLCENCGYNWSWSSDRRRIAYIIGEPSRIEVLDVVSGQRITFLQHPDFSLTRPNISPDDRWLLFSARVPGDRRQFQIVPFRPDHKIQKSDWIAVTDGKSWADVPLWSADGSRIYFTSDSDGSRCVWSQQLNPATKHPVGKPFPVYHSHRTSRSLKHLPLGGGSLAVSRNRVAFGQVELTGNIWLAKLPR
jgi:Tol biopolymer transport system component/DNA-binding winged helix-turn-helix (wHTH) protein